MLSYVFGLRPRYAYILIFLYTFGPLILGFFDENLVYYSFISFPTGVGAFLFYTFWLVIFKVTGVKYEDDENHDMKTSFNSYGSKKERHDSIDNQF